MNDVLKNRYEEFGISPEVAAFGEETCAELSGQFQAFDERAEERQCKVLLAMKRARVSEACLFPSTGYGYNDLGREALERVYADYFGAEDALVRPLFASGTHAISVALSANVKHGDEILLPAGGPYDTLEEVIGIRQAEGSLAEAGITHKIVPLLPDGSFDWEGIRAAVSEKTKLVAIQRSRGYQDRPSFPVAEIGELIRFLKEIRPDLICFVDNCYGEFVEDREPTEVGADLCAGSLIKNPGGGLAPTGGYIVGKKEYVERAAARMTAPGIGREVGASLGVTPAYFQGFFLAPTVTAAAVKGAVFAARLYGKLGFEALPSSDAFRTDIIQAVTLQSKEAMLAFCRGIQAAAPVDAHVVPEGTEMPGYESEVVMAAGTFIQGSSIELSADGPLRPPYRVYFQGGLTWPHAKLGILMSLQMMADNGFVKIPGGPDEL